MSDVGAVRPLCILVAALGGEGGGVLTEWLTRLALAAGFPAQATSIPGVAQRTGATTYYVEIVPVALGASARRPVMSLAPVAGNIDLLIASELLEAGRHALGAMATPDRTTMIASTHRSLTTEEKMQLGDGRVDHARLLAIAARASRRLLQFDMDAAARGAGAMLSAVMFGAIAGSDVLPFSRRQFEDVLGTGAEANLRGFARGYEAIAGTAAPAPATAPAPAAALPPAVAALFPPPTHDLLAPARARVLEFQDADYLALFDRRLERILAAERQADPAGDHGYALTRETARFLALWMAYDDLIRVADRKSRAARFERIRAELGAAPGDVVRIVDHFQPGIEELADLLPGAIARRLLAWNRRRDARGPGTRPLSLRLRLTSSSLGGFLALRFLAALRRGRRRGVRFAREQRRIEDWLGKIEAAAARSWDAAAELALCGRLVKGYGATHARTVAQVEHILAHLADAPAAAIRQAREAALADEGGIGFAQALARHGAPPLAATVQPIRWLPRALSGTAPAIGSKRG
jgi:indolepyruvate ferredoxin oxidoreductase beta subunit